MKKESGGIFFSKSDLFLILQDDGNLVIYGVKAFWASNTN